MMNINKWTLGLAAVGLVTVPMVSKADEKPSSIMTALSSTTISGYVNTSAIYSGGTEAANPVPIAYNQATKQNGFNLNNVDLQIEKPLDEGKWSAGYKVEMWFGPDAAVLGNTLGDSQVSLKNAYVALRAPVGNGIDLKIGTFDSIIGYEVANAGSNPNYTRSYGYTIEPTQNTGLLASYQFDKWIGVAAGIANTLSPGTTGAAYPGNASAGVNTRSLAFDGSPSYGQPLTYMGAVSLVAPDNWGWVKGSTLYAGVVYGWASSLWNPALASKSGNPGQVDSGARQVNYYGGLTLATPIAQLKVGASYDYASGMDDNVFHAGAGALYATWQMGKFSFNGRGEYYQGSKEVFASGLTQAFALTGTVQYDLWANVLSRVEVRWDHSTAGDAFGGSVAGNPTLKDAVMVALNVIYKF